jgi:hypothetical protein
MPVRLLPVEKAGWCGHTADGAGARSRPPSCSLRPVRSGGMRACRPFRELRMDAETFAIAATAQRELAAQGRRRVPLPDLLVGACAQQHAADVLHVDRHYELLASVLAFRPVRP